MLLELELHAQRIDSMDGLAHVGRNLERSLTLRRIRCCPPPKLWCYGGFRHFGLQAIHDVNESIRKLQETTLQVLAEYRIIIPPSLRHAGA
jgi:hypothetical protein